jgi:hypothetical protein
VSQVARDVVRRLPNLMTLKELQNKPVALDLQFINRAVISKAVAS